MSLFSYLLPNCRKADVTPALIEQRGLGDRLWDCLGKRWQDRLSIQDWQGAGLSGVLVTPVTDDMRVLKGDACSHHKSTLGDYVILWGEQPTEQGLKRHRQCEGIGCDLADGAAWIVPIVRQRLADTMLPKSWGLAADGTILEAVEERFEDLWRLSASWLPWVISDQSAAQFFGAGAWMAATMALAVNYRVGREEALLLRLWNTGAIEAALAAAMDRDWYQKKSEDASAAEACHALESLLRGPAESTPSIAPAASTSC